MPEEADQQGTEQQGDDRRANPEHPDEMIDESPGAEVARAAPLLVLGLLLLGSVWWDGAFDLRYWSPLTLLALALLCVLALAGALALPRRGPLAISVAALWAFAGYSLLSAAWSESPAAAWEGGARAIFYAALFTVAVAVPCSDRGRRLAGAGLVIGVVAIGLATELRLLFDGAEAFLAGRLNDPIGYRNGTAALFAFAAWPLVGFAARRGLASGARAAALAAAVLVLGLAFLTQSRGVLLGFVAGGAVSLLIGPDRLRRAWLGLALFAVLAIGSSWLLTPFDASGSGTGAASADDIQLAARALLLLAAGSFLFGLFAFVFDNGLRSPTLTRSARSAGLAGLALIAAAAVVVAVARIGDPVDYADQKWTEFTAVEAPAAAGTRLGTVSGPRHDIWRVALDQFAGAPLAGAGEGSYRFAYFQERRTDRNVADPHSLPLRVLAETGLIGAGLFALWLGALAVALTRRARLADHATRVWIAGLAAAGTVVLVQAAVDWLWLIPGLFGLAVMALGLAARSAEDAGPPLPRTLVARGLVALALVAAMASVGALFLSGVYVSKARQAATAPRASLSAARTAERLNPVSVTPLYLQAAALETEGDRAAARRALREALERERGNFVTLALLGDLETRAGNAAIARDYYRRALALNPRDTGLRELSELTMRSGSR
jgi:O-Antigen ligase